MVKLRPRLCRQFQLAQQLLARASDIGEGNASSPSDETPSHSQSARTLPTSSLATAKANLRKAPPTSLEDQNGPPRRERNDAAGRAQKEARCLMMCASPSGDTAVARGMRSTQCHIVMGTIASPYTSANLLVYDELRGCGRPPAESSPCTWNSASVPITPKMPQRYFGRLG